AGSAQVDLALFDVGGRLVRTLVDGREDAGPHEVAWDGRDGAGRPMASGIYFLRFRTGDYLEVRQIALVR
ncbi:MAG: hypothetical protein KC729_07725, partial [Candidatus Eisenbacteria bacterium]|nr:hypothetical protein [Candidatus Eisenbacteria bacterium]